MDGFVNYDRGRRRGLSHLAVVGRNYDVDESNPSIWLHRLCCVRSKYFLNFDLILSIVSAQT